MEKERKLDTRESLKVVTSNSFITAKGLDSMTLKARKLFYLTISQCKKNDKEFYEYRIPVKAFAEMMGIDESNVYREADKITDELLKASLKVVSQEKTMKMPVTSLCEYSENGSIRIELNPRMTEILLNIKGSFSQPLLSDFMKMRSPYSMAIWHLFQREMHSKKPDSDTPVRFYISLDELREVTGTQNKLKQLVQFKERVLDKAIREIEENCLAKITYENVKDSRTVKGFDFTAYNWLFGESGASEKARKAKRKAELKRTSWERQLTPKEFDELQSLILELDQLSISDFLDVEGSE